MYRAYKTQPKLEKTGETTIGSDGELIRWWRVVGWTEQGTVRDMKEAKERFGGSPVLERVELIQPPRSLQ
jgi:hypothetical protein